MQYITRNKRVKEFIEMGHLISFLECPETTNDERIAELNASIKRGLINKEEALELFTEFCD